MESIKYRIKYWTWPTSECGQWYRTGLMNLKTAKLIEQDLKRYYEEVEIYEDESETK